MKIELKTVQIDGLKAGPDDDLPEGYFRAYFSAFTREPDSYGDVVAKGAFEETLKAWRETDNVLPVLYGHDLTNPFNNLGGAKDAYEDDHGALIEGQLDLENPTAKQVYRMLKGRRISQLSFAFTIREDGVVELEDGRKARELRKMDVHEVSIVPMGANPDTEVLAVKAVADGLKAVADGLKAGRTLSAKNLASLVSARDALTAVIDTAGEGSPDDPDKASQTAVDVKAQERTTSTASSRSAQAVAIATAVLTY